MSKTTQHWPLYLCANCGIKFVTDGAVPSQEKALQLIEAGLADVPNPRRSHSCLSGDVGVGQFVGWQPVEPDA